MKLPRLLQQKEVNLAVERRRFWNRHPRLSSAVWFGSAAAISGALIAIVFHQGLFLAFGLVASVAAAIIGAVYGITIGRSRSGDKPTLKNAVSTGAVIVFMSYFGMMMPIALLALLKDASAAAIGSLIFGVFACAIFAMIFTGWITFPIGIGAAINLHKLRSKIPAGPVVLGCAQKEHIAELNDREREQ
jgi:drug/metabolite transporter (DMT)-like permease